MADGSQPRTSECTSTTSVGAGAGTSEPLQGALQFGYEMGTGMRTHMPSNLPYVAVVAGLLLPPWWGALLAGVGFAAGRIVMSVGRWSDQRWEGAWQASERAILIGLNLVGGMVFAIITWPAIAR